MWKSLNICIHRCTLLLVQKPADSLKFRNQQSKQSIRVGSSWHFHECSKKPHYGAQSPCESHLSSCEHGKHGAVWKIRWSSRHPVQFFGLTRGTKALIQLQTMNQWKRQTAYHDAETSNTILTAFIVGFFLLMLGRSETSCLGFTTLLSIVRAWRLLVIFGQCKGTATSRLFFQPFVRYVKGSNQKAS